eukprot:CAMPEP_0183559018 /NCGR_PEP_ID=MMETSP0371-20130417/90421_1 /TAXON_ID=268820 /ORGANISM="Peridinium aciculiferum, Strain PAER-2" /LENGTH=276 /DNA_ID=CAMNT_0025766653 /DNA_START=163 /DNA_END=992 /DNA_ORIENTATION=-
MHPAWSSTHRTLTGAAYQVDQRARSEHEHPQDNGRELGVHRVLLLFHLLRFMFQFRRTLCVELDVQHEASRAHEEHQAPLDAEDGALPPPPHPLVLVEPGGLVKTGGASRHQPDREEELKGEHPSGHRGQKHCGDHHEEAHQLDDADVDHAAGPGKVIRELEALLHRLLGEKRGDDSHGFEGRQTFVDHVLCKEPGIVLQLGGALALHELRLVNHDHLRVRVLRLLDPGLVLLPPKHHSQKGATHAGSGARRERVTRALEVFVKAGASLPRTETGL